MTIRDITSTEWIMVCKSRAEKLTGYSCHERKYGNATSFYIWKMGEQPYGSLFKSLSAGSPLRAADKFLSLFAPQTPNSSGYMDSFKLPEVRTLTKKEPT